MKKIFFTLLLVFGFAQLISVQASTDAKTAEQVAASASLALQPDLSGSFATMTTEEFFNLTPKKFKEATGKKLRLKEKIGLKLAQKALKKQMKAADAGIEKGVYIILAIFIPFLAVGLATNFEGTDWLIALLLTFLFWLPGIIYAFIKMADYYP
ncbi:MAG: YqaE/Pmp3 family membrane protein [Saprospiraceae bacterium]